MTHRAVVIGLGNDARCDDGVGAAVIAALAVDPPVGARLEVVDADVTRLLDARDGCELAVVVDAVRCDPACPGAIHRMDLGDGGDAGAIGRRAQQTHAVDVAAAARLAAALDRAPRRVVVLGVEAADLGSGVGLSPAVRAAVPEAARRVLAELSPPVGP